MADSAVLENSTRPAGAKGATSPEPRRIDTAQSAAESGNSWNASKIAGLFGLVMLWALKLYTTWGAWGNLTIDSGHEMYIPLLLAQGKQLYRDVWFMYGPIAPYFTSYLYRIFGARLEVLYWAGSLSALGSAVLLYLTGIRLSASILGWTAGAVVLTDVFQRSLFCFPLPYASAAVYGCVAGCFFLWLIVGESFSRSRIRMLAAGTVAALSLLIKPEFGIACYGTAAFLVAARLFAQRSWKMLAEDMATMLPGLALCAWVIFWMVSIRGFDFITQENIVSWPSSYFMKVYGKMWLERNGFTVSPEAFAGAIFRTVPVLGVALALYLFLRWKRLDTRSILTRTLIVLALVLYFVKHNYFILAPRQDAMDLLRTVFFPEDMVLYVVVAAAAAWIYFCWRPATSRALAIALLFTFSSLLAFRILMKMRSWDYSIFYNGPVVLSFLLLLCFLVPRLNRSRRSILLTEAALCLGCLTPVWMFTQSGERGLRELVPLTTERGTVLVGPDVKERYIAAIQFMKDKAADGKSVLVLPEDTSLYFLSGTYCPIRMFSFTPGVLAPGKMTTDTIQEIDRKRVDYLLWSSERTFHEFGVPIFGEDFDREVGDYLRAHYRPIGPDDGDESRSRRWSDMVWERKLELDSPPGPK